MITKVVNPLMIYYVDQYNRRQGELQAWYDDKHEKLQFICHYVDDKKDGEYREWDIDGILFRHCFYLSDELHGECMLRWWGGDIMEHDFYQSGVKITDKVELIVRGMSYITDAERIILKLKFGIECLEQRKIC